MHPRGPQISRELGGLFLPLLVGANRQVSSWIEDRLPPLGVTPAQFRIVGALLGREEGITQRELATRVGLEPATLSVALRKLEEAGIIERPTDPEDRRARRVRCASRIQHLGSILKMLKELDERALEGLSEKEIALTRRVLAKIHQNLASAQAGK